MPAHMSALLVICLGSVSGQAAAMLMRDVRCSVPDLRKGMYMWEHSGTQKRRHADMNFAVSSGDLGHAWHFNRCTNGQLEIQQA